METENRETIIIQNQSNGAATTSLVLGIIGFIVGLIPYLGWFMIPVWLLAIFFGLIGMRKKYKRGTAIIGFIFGLLGAAYKIGFWIFAAGGILAAATIFSNGSDNLDGQTVKEVKVRDDAPEFVATDMDGMEHRLSDYKGKGVYLYFTATWINSFEKDIRNINNQYLQFKDQDVQVLVIALDPDFIVNTSISKDQLDAPVIPDGNEELSDSYGIDVLPMAVLIDSDGKIIDIDRSNPSEKDIKKQMEQIKP